jgi:hypothetical protein
VGIHGVEPDKAAAVMELGLCSVWRELRR